MTYDFYNQIQQKSSEKSYRLLLTEEEEKRKKEKKRCFESKQTGEGSHFLIFPKFSLAMKRKYYLQQEKMQNYTENYYS